MDGMDVCQYQNPARVSAFFKNPGFRPSISHLLLLTCRPLKSRTSNISFFMHLHSGVSNVLITFITTHLCNTHICTFYPNYCNERPGLFFLLGHNKPVIALMVLIARARPNVILSLLTTEVLYPKIIGELEKKLEKEWEFLRSRIK